jgi:hypothetical protein
MRLSIICGLAVTVCTGIALTAPGFAQLHGSSPGFSSPSFSTTNKTLEFENEQKQKKTLENSPFKNQDVKTKETKTLDKTGSDKTSKSEKFEKGTKSGALNTKQGKTSKQGESQDKKETNVTTINIKETALTTKESSGDVKLLSSCEKGGGNASDCTRAIKDCSAAKGGDTSACVDGAMQLMAGCSGAPGKGGTGVGAATPQQCSRS